MSKPVKQIKHIQNDQADAYMELDSTPGLPDVSRMKVRKITVKNPEKLKRKIKDVNYQRGGYEGGGGRNSYNEEDYARSLSNN